MIDDREKRGYLLGTIAGMGQVITTLPNYGLEDLSYFFAEKTTGVMKMFIDTFDFTEEEFFIELGELRDWVDEALPDELPQYPEEELDKLTVKATEIVEGSY